MEEKNSEWKPFSITREQLMYCEALIKEAEADLFAYDILAKEVVQNEMGSFLNRRKIFFLQQAEEKLIKSMLPECVRYLSIPIMMIAGGKNSANIRTQKVIDIYIKKINKKMEQAFKPKDLRHDISSIFKTRDIFEDALIQIALLYPEVDQQILMELETDIGYIHENDIEVVLRALKEGTPLLKKAISLIEELQKKMPKPDASQVKNLAPDTVLTITATDRTFLAMHFGLLNILSKYVETARYPEGQFENDSIKKLVVNEKLVREAIGYNLKYSQNSISSVRSELDRP